MNFEQIRHVLVLSKEVPHSMVVVLYGGPPSASLGCILVGLGRAVVFPAWGSVVCLLVGGMHRW